ncbi:MAG: flagellar M-ring protein FliF, partial [Zavarzinia sp.]
GYDEKRGDQIRVVNLPFVDTQMPEAAAADLGFLGLTKDDYFKIGEIGVLGLVALLLTFFVIRPLVGRLLAPLEGPALAGATPGAPGTSHFPGGAGGGAPRLAGPDGRPMLAGPQDEEMEQMIDIANIEGRVKASSLKRVGEIVQSHPEEALSVMRNWMYRES